MTDMTLRTAAANDEDAKIIAGLHVASKKEGYAPFADQDYLNGLTQEAFTKNWREWLGGTVQVQIAEMDDSPAGFIATGPIRTRLKEDRGIMPKFPGEVYALYVHPDFWGQGVAEALFEAGKTAMKKAYHIPFILWVIENNKRAISFYEKMGGQRGGKQKITLGDNQNLTELALIWKK